MTLKDLRVENKKTATEVAAVLGVSIRALYNYEQGMRAISLEQVLKLATLYGLSAEEVIEAQLRSIEIRKA